MITKVSYAVVHLGNYYAEKISGETSLYSYRATDDSGYHKKSFQNIEKALVHSIR